MNKEEEVPDLILESTCTATWRGVRSSMNACLKDSMLDSLIEAQYNAMWSTEAKPTLELDQILSHYGGEVYQSDILIARYGDKTLYAGTLARSGDIRTQLVVDGKSNWQIELVTRRIYELKAKAALRIVQDLEDCEITKRSPTEDQLEEIEQNYICKSYELSVELRVETGDIAVLTANQVKGRLEADDIAVPTEDVDYVIDRREEFLNRGV